MEQKKKGRVSQSRVCLWVTRFFIMAGVIVSEVAGQDRQLPVCTESDYHYQYTECDSVGSRWRVAVPHTPGICTGLPDPVRGTECSFSCKAGQFLEMKTQSCKECVEGTYSLGTGVRIDQWDTLPPGFSNTASDPNGEYADDMANCSNSIWQPQGDYIASNTDECTATLMYAVNLKQSGSISFSYFHPDSSIFFEFFVQNDQCQSTAGQSRWMKSTDNEWASHYLQLGRGNNVLYWRTTGFSMDTSEPKPVLVKNVIITDTGSGACQQRSPCTQQDYFYTHTPCDASGQTQLMYKWIEPKICSEDLKGAVKLPASGAKIACPPCNPGFFKTNSSSCEPCPYGSYSNGTECRKCPAGTEPVLGFEYKWWNQMPANMRSLVSGEHRDFEEQVAWEAAGEYIYTPAMSANDYMMLVLTVSGFRLPQHVATDSENTELARVTFVFETKCTTDCQFYFLAGANERSNTLVEQWSRSKEKQSYSYIVNSNSTVIFTWAFQRATGFSNETRYNTDVAKIYSIKVTNAINGVASSCRHCALGSSKTASSCVPCPSGHYIEKDSSACRQCPPDTFLSREHPYGEEACVPCGPKTHSNAMRSTCFSDCKFDFRDGERTLQYDFSHLPNRTTFNSGPSFTPKGLQYFHQFSVSLCGNEGKKLASCVDNVTSTRTVSSYACQSTIVPSDLRGVKTVVSSQPISLADRLVGVTTEAVLENITSPADLFPTKSRIPDVIFFYRSSEATQSCKKGRATTIRMRCDTGGSARLSVPSKCQEGTCDGCAFHFLWETEDACPLCSENDYHQIMSACIQGIQKMTYVWREPRLCTRGAALPEQAVNACKTLDFWLKLGLSTGIIAALLLVMVSCYFWKKTQKLEYKYSKLVMNSSLKDCELPAADSCAIMEGEDGEDDLILLTKKSIFGKIKSFSTKRTSDGFDCVPLKSSSEHNDVEL
ncbi:endosome/lysosome-associated apoptosis and autophagy regulator 1-like isoform X2 [Polyodon spathula]|uniref:endosome/lysosome-associated apoptosis and autophagy regulator 1-like isoform X2 n=1 Tax=Polyodon spathula TaxID=7913 RepID=UPI001B7F5D5C|nr:endosome/lysosome-associated apoptosis and autophagy regulator 1-like isoform X2 [Polyodon spathula]